MLDKKNITASPGKQADEDTPDITKHKILMGYWYNGLPEKGEHNGFPGEFSLTEIPKEYNVVAVGFIKSDGTSIPTFKPYKGTDAEFRAQVDELNSQGRVVLVSLGGADGKIELKPGEEQALADEIIRLVDVYGFDGLDLDLEQSAIQAAANAAVIPAAMRIVRDYYDKRLKYFILSLSTGFPNLKEGGIYISYVDAVNDIYDFVTAKYYDHGDKTVWVETLGLDISQSNDEHKEEFIYTLTQNLIKGAQGYKKIFPTRLAIGLPTNKDAAVSGYVINEKHLKNALTVLADEGHVMRGLTAWSTNWDEGIDSADTRYDWEFASRFGYITIDEEHFPRRSKP